MGTSVHRAYCSYEKHQRSSPEGYKKQESGSFPADHRKQESVIGSIELHNLENVTVPNSYTILIEQGRWLRSSALSFTENSIRYG